MILLDTDTLSLLMHGHKRVTERATQCDELNITIVTRIEILKGRFDTVLKAATGTELMLAQRWLDENEKYLVDFAIVPFDSEASAQFEMLRQITKLKKIGRGDILIASIALAKRAKLITRNLKHFRLVPGLKVENWAD